MSEFRDILRAAKVDRVFGLGQMQVVRILLGSAEALVHLCFR